MKAANTALTTPGRRSFITALGAGALAAPFALHAQPAALPAGKVWRVGILPPGPMATRVTQWDAFRARMRELGYIEGKNLEYVTRAPATEGGPADALAEELVRAGVDVIVASTTPAIVSAKRATQRIPIVMCPTNGDPVELGFVASLRRPGGNITGVSSMLDETTGKRMQLARELVPKATRIAFLWNTSGKTQFEAAGAAARQLGVRLQSLEVQTAEALPAAFAAAVKERAEVLMVASNGFTLSLRSNITALALKHRLPSVFALALNAEAGGLLTYGPSQTAYFGQAAVQVDKILKGAKVAELPVEQPTRFDFVINQKTAKALGITVPPVVLLQAERVIE